MADSPNSEERFDLADLVTSFAISDDAYEVIHNFFRAVRLWRTRTPTTID